MSEESESLDLSARDLMPNWVTDLEKPPARRREEKPATDRTSKTRPKRKSDRGRPRGFHRDDRGGGKGRSKGGNRRDSQGDRSGRDRRGGGRGRDFDRRGKGKKGGRGGGGRRDRDRDRGRSAPQEDRLPDVEVVVRPAPGAVKALANHIRGTGRAYAMADVARMVLQARDRYQLEFRTRASAGGGAGKAGEAEGGGGRGPVSFFYCDRDGSLWLSRDEAVAHVLRSPVLKEFYAFEDVEVDPPKGNFAVIAVCGMSGRILGPPNHHEYAGNVARLQGERFSGMSLERYKSRIEMHRDEETLEKWKTQASRKRVYRVGPAADPASADPDSEKGEAESTSDQPPEPEPEPETEEEEIPEPEAGEADESAAPEGEAGNGEAVEEEAEETETPGDGEAGAESSGDEENREDEEAEGGESAGEPIEADADEAETGAPEEPAETEMEPGPDDAAGDAAEGETLDNEAELRRHFLENHADEVIRLVSSAVVAGDISGRDLSGPLLSKLKSEVDRIKRSFPLPMIQRLCREFEKEGLRFFKRGKKALYVSVTRPRPIANEEAFTDRIRSIVAFVREHPRAPVIDLLDALVPDYEPPPGGESFEEHHLTRAEHDVLGDLRWLTMEGYVIEFPNSELLLGGHESSSPGKTGSPGAKGKTGKGRQPAPNKPDKTEPKTDPEKAGEKPEAAPAIGGKTPPPEPASGSSGSDDDGEEPSQETSVTS